MLLRVFTYLFALLVAMGCSTDERGNAEQPSGKFGTLHFGEEKIPVNTVRVSDSGDWLLVVLSPLEEGGALTTNAIIGLKKELLDVEVDVEYKYPNSDYILVYEDPQCYYAPYRALKSGKIWIRSGANSIGVDVDVVLYDGTHMQYTCWELPK